MAGKTPEVRASHSDRDRAVETLRMASADGRLTAEELDSRLEVALTATTRAELAEVVADLPTVHVGDDYLVIEQSGGTWERTGAWVVPSRIRIKTKVAKVVLDFREAVITAPVLQIEANIKNGKLVIIGGRQIAIDVDGVVFEYSKVKFRPEPKVADPLLRIEIVGKLKHSRIVEKWPKSA